MERKPFFEADDEDDDESEDSSVIVPKPPRRQAAEPEPESQPNLPELPLEKLTPDERTVVEQDLVHELPPVEPESPDPADELAAAAVETFRERILNEDLPADEALAETLADLEPPEPEAAPEPDSPVELPAEEETVWLRPAASAVETAPPPAPAPRPERRAAERPETVSATPLIGGVVGYLMGRRRGRIKTERKLLPVQKKLEKEVKQLRGDLAEKEKTIRRVARERAAEKPAVVERLRERLVPLPLSERLETPPQPAPERIGHVVVRAEKEAPPVVEKMPEQPIETSAQRVAIERHVETLTRQELLAISDKIVVEGASLRRIYETHQISERGLRRLVSEHLRGKNVKKALKRELLERQIDFERDPAMRDLGAASSVSPALDRLLEKVHEQATAEQRQELAVWKARAAHQAAQSTRSQHRRRAADITMVSTIAVLLALVIIMLLTRH